jgi:hypothetical protein
MEDVDDNENDTNKNDEFKIQIVREPKREYYPLCIVWSPIPLLSWLFPFIGHAGIVTSEGIIHDFAGSYTVNVTAHHNPSHLRSHSFNKKNEYEI